MGPMAAGVTAGPQCMSTIEPLMPRDAFLTTVVEDTAEVSTPLVSHSTTRYPRPRAMRRTR